MVDGCQEGRLRLWIDLDNSPHVLFFAPLVRRFRAQGVEVLITARAFSQTEELARAHGLDYVCVGEHRTPRTVVGRGTATLRRAWQLAQVVRNFRPAAAFSHGSRALVLAASWLRIPSATLYDYEFSSKFIFHHFSSLVAVPDSIPDHRVGAMKARLVKYPGFKEEVYLCEFKPDPGVIRRLGLDPTRPIVTIRPPAEWAHYHSDHSQVLFAALIERLRPLEYLQVVILTRTHAQYSDLNRRYGLSAPPFHPLKEAVDGLSLMWCSDAIFSGGGTMVREAALLGLRVFSTFAGDLGAVDEVLERSGRLRVLRQRTEIAALDFVKLPVSQKTLPGRATQDFIYGMLLDFLQQARVR